MQNTYFLMEITKPENIAQSGYQAIDTNGKAVLMDMEGNPITLPSVYEYAIITSEPQFPEWGS